VLEDFRTLVLDDGRHRWRKRLWQADKGHGAMLAEWIKVVSKGMYLIEPHLLLSTTATTLFCTMPDFRIASEQPGLSSGGASGSESSE
jgi:hypothetical protein